MADSFTSRASAMSWPIQGSEKTAARIQSVAGRREFVQPGDPVNPKAIVDGWVGGFVTLDDGRRQVVDLFLPGETLAPRAPQPKWHIGLKALAATRLSSDPELLCDQAVESQHNYLYQTNAILRLGCLNAYERLGHFFLEMFDRITRHRTGSRPIAAAEYRGDMQRGAGAGIVFPLTQEIMADLLGLSAVHINRTLQQLRRHGLVILGGGRLILPEPDKLARVCHYDFAQMPLQVVERHQVRANG